jgi:hypothetical protein
LIYVGNIFLRWSHSRILMFPQTHAWQQWECDCYRRLYGGGCQPVGDDAVLIDPFPGESLRTLLIQNHLTDAAMQAAALEFRRVHELDGWSHGDPHLDNVLFDGKRARLIDFETQHLAGLSVEVRQADDLLVLLLDLIGRDSTESWQRWSQILLRAYDNAEVVQELQNRLIVPKGLELVLWKSRTNTLPGRILRQRINNLNSFVSDYLTESSSP